MKSGYHIQVRSISFIPIDLFQTLLHTPESIYTFALKQLRLLLCWCFTALRHFSGHSGRSQLTYPHCSWASLLCSLPVLSAHSLASNWQLPVLNQRKGGNGRRNDFMTNLHGRMLPEVRLEPATVRIPGGRVSDRATAPGGNNYGL